MAHEIQVMLNGLEAATVDAPLPEVGAAFPHSDWEWATVKSVQVADGGYLIVEVE